MADGEHPVSAPMTPRAAVIPPVVSQENVDPVGTINIAPAIDREEYILQLENQLKELRNTVQQLQQQQQTQAIQPQAMPPPVSMPLPLPEFIPLFHGFQSNQQQYFYPYPPPWYLPPVTQKRECMYNQFLDYRPLVFYGSMDPAVTLNWIRPTVKARDKRKKDKVVVQKQKQDQSSSQQRKRWQENQNQTRRFPVGSCSSGSSFSTVQRPQWCNRCRVSHVGLCTPQTRRCIRCGGCGHEVKDCKFPRNVCWNCQKEGHRSGDCPSARKLGSGIGIGASTTGGSSSASQKRKNPPAPEGRAVRMTVDDATTANDVITGKEGTQ